MENPSTSISKPSFQKVLLFLAETFHTHTVIDDSAMELKERRFQIIYERYVFMKNLLSKKRTHYKN